ncbi:MAG: hypothetical protein ACRD6W_12980 [Nitrososphaerales archaeon]
MTTEYERLLTDLLKERRDRLEKLKDVEGRDKKEHRELLSEIGFVQVELERDQKGMALFRSKGLPKVGRWGKPETSQTGEALP